MITYGHLVVPLALAVLAASAGAQADAQALLLKSIGKMASLNSVVFETTESQDPASTRQFKKRVAAMGVPVAGGKEQLPIRCRSTDGILHARLNNGEDEVVLYRRRLVARAGEDGDWRLRGNRLQDGKPLPFLLDPNLFFDVLKHLPRDALAIRHREEQQIAAGRRILLGVSLQGAAAREFALSGALPTIRIGAVGMALAGMLIPEAAKAAEANHIVDLAFTIDPVSGLVERVRTATYQVGGNIPARAIVIGGRGAAPREEADEDTDKKKAMVYQQGLPVRKLAGDTSRMGFDVVFQKHGQPVEIRLDAAGRKLLRL